jgi:hypothetical protein
MTWWLLACFGLFWLGWGVACYVHHLAAERDKAYINFVERHFSKETDVDRQVRIQSERRSQP